MTKTARSGIARVAGPDLADPWRLDRPLGDVLRRAATDATRGLTCVDDQGNELRLSYAELLAEAERIAAGLAEAGVRRGDKVILQTCRARQCLPALWACVLSGVAAAPVIPERAVVADSPHVRKMRTVWDLLDRPLVIADEDCADALTAVARDGGWGNLKVTTATDLRAEAPASSLPDLPPDTLAMLPSTSGSTGTPKVVQLTHRNILAMASGTVQDNGFAVSDTTLNWMPLDHPGALVFLGVVPADAGAEQIHVPTHYVLGDPLRWLDLIERHRAAVSWAPNFAFALVNEKLATCERVFDLSSMRFLVSAGEQVAAATARTFLERLEAHGLPRGALRPAFGMAETCSGITWSRGLDREALADNPTYVSLGPPIPGAALRVVGDSGTEMAEGETGALQLRGPSVMGGYYRNPKVNAEVMREGGWFVTGDLAYLKDGELIITGRDSQTIIINGLNIPAHDIEAAAEEVDGVAVSFSAAFAVWNEARSTEDLAVVFSPETTGDEEPADVARRLRAHLIKRTGIAPAHIIALPGSDIPKTSIGKIQRAALKKRFEQGELAAQIIPIGAPRPARRAVADPETEAAITEIWKEALKLDAIDPDASFFELGGHSVLLIEVHSRLQERFPSLDLVDLFQHSTVRALTAFLSGAAAPSDAVHRPVRMERDDIAIIGMACRFPGADSIDAFWRNLREGKESIARFTVDELVAAGFDRRQVSDPHYVPASPVIDDPKGFDAAFFGYSAREAELLDPQQRLFLQCAWETMEDAGYDPLRYAGRIGAFAGVSMNTYFFNNVMPNRHRLDARDPIDVFTLDSMGGFQAMVANDKDYVATRVSFKLDLRGPSVNVQTACSTGLVVAHLAAQSLLNGECEMALAGTASVQSPQAAGHLWQDGMLVSADGHCRAFDAEATGTVFGSGVGAVLLKPLSKALADGDHVYAVIKGSAVGNDGGQKLGYMAPSGAGETAVAREALAAADVAPETITFMEAHGTATPLGDPIEVKSLAAALQTPGRERPACALGSVKTNVGHLQISSGIVGLIKTALALHHREIPPTLHFRTPNPEIDLAAGPFFVNTETIPWDTDGMPRRAGVNSLGIGGTNAHLILEEAPASDASAVEDDHPLHVLTLSARSEAALAALRTAYVRFLDTREGIMAADLCFTANTGRKAFDVRRSFVFESLAALRGQLADAGGYRPRRAATTLRPVWAVAPGFKAVPGLGGDLFRTAPVFRRTLEELADTALIDALYHGAAWPDDAAFAERATRCLIVALGRLWLSWGVAVRAFRESADLAADIGIAAAAVTTSEPNGDDYVLDVLPDGDGDGALWPGLLNALARLHDAGGRVDWQAFDAPYPRKRLSLPTYPFETRPYWLDPPALPKTRTTEAAAPVHPLIDRTFASPLAKERFFETDYHVDRQPLLGDHRINDRVVVSAACHVAMALGAGGAPRDLCDVGFESFLTVPPEGKTVQLVTRPMDDGRTGFTIVGNDAGQIYATGVLDAPGRTVPRPPVRATCEAACPTPMALADFRAILKQRRIDLGPRYQWMTALSVGDGQAFARLSRPEAARDDGFAGPHPGLIDAGFGLMIAATASGLAIEETFVPTGIDRLRVHETAIGDGLWAWGRFTVTPDNRGAKGDIFIVDDSGAPVLTAEGLSGRAAAWEGEAVMSAGTLQRIVWRPSPLNGKSTPSGANWIVLGNDAATAASLEAALEPTGGKWMSADDPAGCGALLDAVIAQGADGPVGVVLLCAGNPARDALVVSQAVAARMHRLPDLALWFVTRGAWSVAGEPCRPEAAAAGGLAKAVRQEQPGFRLRVVDFDGDTADLAERLLGELAAGGDATPEVAWRGETRFEARLEPLDDVPSTPPALGADAAYMVTGASGALGRLVLQWLADNGARNIVAVSRSGQVDETVRQKLEASGATLLPLRTDVADPEALRTAWRSISRPVRGIVHAAGILEDATLQTATPEQLVSVSRPKSGGARALAELTKPEDLDFLVLFSSAASVIGNAGQAAYAAANAELDALAVDLRTRGFPATAISWGPWQGDGMAGRSEKARAAFQRMGVRPFDPQDGLGHLNAALNAGFAHVCALDCDWDRYLAQNHQANRDFLAAFARPVPQPPSPSSNGIKVTLDAAASDARRAILFDFVMEQVGEALAFTGDAAIDPDMPLMDQGLDSLATVGLRASFNKTIGCALPVGAFFEYPSVDALTDHLLATLYPPDQGGVAPADIDDVDLDGLDLAELEALVNKELGG